MSIAPSFPFGNRLDTARFCCCWDCCCWPPKLPGIPRSVCGAAPINCHVSNGRELNAQKMSSAQNRPRNIAHCPIAITSTPCGIGGFYLFCRSLAANTPDRHGGKWRDSCCSQHHTIAAALTSISYLYAIQGRFGSHTQRQSRRGHSSMGRGETYLVDS